MQKRERIMTKCDSCNDSATMTVEGYLCVRYLCSLHASKLAELLGAYPSEVKKMKEHA